MLALWQTRARTTHVSQVLQSQSGNLSEFVLVFRDIANKDTGRGSVPSVQAQLLSIQVYSIWKTGKYQKQKRNTKSTIKTFFPYPSRGSSSSIPPALAFFFINLVLFLNKVKEDEEDVLAPSTTSQRDAIKLRRNIDGLKIGYRWSGRGGLATVLEGSFYLLV